MMAYLSNTFQVMLPVGLVSQSEVAALYLGNLPLQLPNVLWWLLALSLLLLPNAANCHERITWAGQPHLAPRFWGVLYLRQDVLVTICVVLGLIWLLWHIPVGLVLAALIITAASAKVFRARKLFKQHQQHQEYLLRLLTVMSAQLRAGSDVIQALERSLEVPDLPAEIHTGVQAAARSMRQGGTGEAHLAAVAGLSQLATILQASQTRGIAAAELITQTQMRLQTTREYARSLQAETQGARVTARILMALPLVGMGMALVLGIDIFHFFSATTFGQGVLIAGAGSAVCGWLWTERMIAHACDPAT